MRYIFVEDCADSGAHIDFEEFETAEDAVRYGDKEYAVLARFLKDTDAMYIMESSNPDPDSEDHYEIEKYVKVYKFWGYHKSEAYTRFKCEIRELLCDYENLTSEYDELVDAIKKENDLSEEERNTLLKEIDLVI